MILDGDGKQVVTERLCDTWRISEFSGFRRIKSHTKYDILGSIQQARYTPYRQSTVKLLLGLYHSSFCCEPGKNWGEGTLSSLDECSK